MSNDQFSQEQLDVLAKVEKSAQFEPITLQEVILMATLEPIRQPSHMWFLDIRGQARECKVNGKIRTWKRDKERVEIPVKYGLYEYFTFYTNDIKAGRLLRRIS